MNRGVRFTQVTAPRGTFPLAGSTSSGLAASQYTQTSPTPAQGTQYALSVSWCSLDHRLRRPKKGSPGASAGPPCRLIYYHNNQEMGKSQSHISAHFAPVEVQRHAAFKLVFKSSVGRSKTSRGKRTALEHVLNRGSTVLRAA